MGMNKLKWAFATTLVAAVVIAAGTASLAKLGRDDPPGKRVDPPEKRVEVKAKATPAPVSQPNPMPQPTLDRTVTGIVIDEKDRPLAKVWVGSDLRPMPDTWDNPRPEDIRERREPFRDPKGEIIPPGAVGKYFEVRDSRNAWRPISPDDIRIFEPHVFTSKGPMSKEEVARTYSTYTVRVEKGGWWMAGMPGFQNPVRTDAQGRFSTKFPLNGPTKLHFASSDYSLQATHRIKLEDPDKPLEVILRPTRLVRARVIEVPNDDPKAYLNWTVYAADQAGKFGDEWQRWMLPNMNNHDPDHVKRRLEVRLPVGRWKAEFRSQTLLQAVDIEVPPGVGPLDLPDFRLESLATVRMVGHPAAEIEATDLEGKPVHLADFRGQVVVLDFWANWCGPCIQAMPRLMAITERFRDKPLVVLAIHDGSVTGAAEYNKAIEPIKERFWKGADLPFLTLLDLAPVAKGMRLYSQGPGEKGSGRSADAYEVSSWPSTFVIAPDGKLVGKFELEALESVLEDQFGVPHANPKPSRPTGRAAFPTPKRNVKVRGRVVGPDGRGVAGAKLKPEQAVVRQQGIATDAQGDFGFEAEEIFIDHFFLRVEAPGLASKMFRLDDSGEVREPLELGVGAVVTGRVLRDGKPVGGLAMGLNQVQRHSGNYLGQLSAKTDEQGRFRFDHAFADQECVAFAQTGGLKDGGSVIPRPIRTKGDGSSVDLGDFEVEPGRKLAGRVIFADGKAIPPGTRVLASAENAGGTIFAPVDTATGRFEVVGLPATEVEVVVQFPGLTRSWLPPGYRLSPGMKCVDPLNPHRLMGQFDRHVADLTILFEPGPEPRANMDPGGLEDFKEAKAGTIVGAPPGSIRSK